jgi:thiol:disulfide interchange protein DsbC
MKKIILLSFAFLVFATSPVLAGSCGDDAKSALRNAYPNFAFKEVNPSPIDALCEVVSEKNTLYFAPVSSHLVFGEIWSKEGKNITAERQGERTAQALADLPLTKAVKIGSGTDTVIEITDPDCPFCRKGSEHFAAKKGVTRYVFFLPLDRLHPSAARKAEFILASTDQATAYEQVMKGAYDQNPLPEFTPNGLLAEHRKIMAGMQISLTPRYFINGKAVAGFNAEQIDSMLQHNPELVVSGTN